MAAKIRLYCPCSCTHKISSSPKSSSSSSSSSCSNLLAFPGSICSSPSHSHLRAPQFKLQAKLGGEEGELKPKGKRKFITRDEEPEQYWQTAGEREGENPMKTPLPYIIIFGMSTPFVILAIAFANGWIKVPVR